MFLRWGFNYQLSYMIGWFEVLKWFSVYFNVHCVQKLLRSCHAFSLLLKSNDSNERSHWQKCWDSLLRSFVCLSSTDPVWTWETQTSRRTTMAAALHRSEVRLKDSDVWLHPSRWEQLQQGQQRSAERKPPSCTILSPHLQGDDEREFKFWGEISL